MVEVMDDEPGWELIPPALAAVARRSGISAAELLAFRDDPANQDDELPEFDDHDWDRILAPAPEYPSDDGLSGQVTTAVGYGLHAAEESEEPSAADRRCALSRLEALRPADVSARTVDVVHGGPAPAGDAAPANTLGVWRDRTTDPAGTARAAHCSVVLRRAIPVHDTVRPILARASARAPPVRSSSDFTRRTRSVRRTTPCARRRERERRTEPDGEPTVPHPIGHERVRSQMTRATAA